MIDSYNDSTGSRKKFLIPLVVLLLCAVSLTGAGYAYNASMIAPDNGADAGDLQIDLIDGADSVHITVDDAIVFTDNFTYNASYTQKHNVVDAYAQGGKIVFDVTIKGEATAEQVNVSSEDLETYLATVIGNNVTIGDLVTVAVSFADDAEHAIPVPADGTAAVLNLDPDKEAGATVDKNLYVFFKPVDNDAHIVMPSKEITNPLGASPNFAADFLSIIENANFDLKIEAVGPATA